MLALKGDHHYLCRAVDQEGNVLDILVQRRRNKQAAKKFFCKLLKGLTTYRGSSFSTNSRAMEPPNAKFFQESNIASTGISTTGRRTPTSPRADGSGACSGSNHRATPNGFSRPLVPSPSTSVRAGIDSPCLPIVRRCRTDSRAGGRSQVPPWLPERNKQSDLFSLSLILASMRIS